MSEWPEGWSRGGDRPGRGPSTDGEERTQVLRRPGASTTHPDYAPAGPPAPPSGPPRPVTPSGPPPLPPAPARRRRLLWVLGAALLALVLLLVGLLLFVNSRLDRVDALRDYAGRPAATPGRDYLLVGSDSRAGLSREQRRELHTGATEGRRTDTIMLLHVPEGGGRTTLVSLPRDSYVEIPAFGDRPASRNKLNAAYSFGGARLLARTVEQATGIRLDDYVEIGFGGFVELTDAVGGVELCPKQAIEDARSGLNVRKGCQEMDGPTALGYVRARYSDPRGDLGRVERQREFLGAVGERVASPGVLLNPFRLWGVTDAGLDSLRVDEDTGPIDLFRLFLRMRELAAGDAATTTVPVADPNFATDVGSTVLWDEEGAAELFAALREDRPVPRNLLVRD